MSEHELKYHERCRSVLLAGHRLYGSSLDAGFTSVDDKGTHHEWPHVAVVELDRLASELKAAKAEAAKWKGLYEKAWAECLAQHAIEEECLYHFDDSNPREVEHNRNMLARKIMAEQAHDSARREAGLDGGSNANP